MSDFINTWGKWLMLKEITTKGFYNRAEFERFDDLWKAIGGDKNKKLHRVYFSPVLKYLESKKIIVSEKEGDIKSAALKDRKKGAKQLMDEVLNTYHSRQFIDFEKASKERFLMAAVKFPV